MSRCGNQSAKEPCQIYWIDGQEERKRDDIYRVGYAPGDSEETPFASVPVVNLDGEEKRAVITAENAGQLHTMKIEVDGNNDVLTYPRLNKTGFFAGKDTRACFRSLSVRNPRHPSNVFIRETAAGNLYGEKSIFDGLCGLEDGCFIVEDAQITADPSGTSVPMFRMVFSVREDKKLEKARLYMTARCIRRRLRWDHL